MISETCVNKRKEFVPAAIVFQLSWIVFVSVCYRIDQLLSVLKCQYKCFCVGCTLRFIEDLTVRTPFAFGPSHTIRQCGL
jgi:hypothetical protein